MNTIEINHLTKIYKSKHTDIHALNDVSLRIEGGMFGLLGPNGAGKTTLMRIIAGLVSPTQGSVSVGPYNLANEAGKIGLKSMLGYLPQDLGVYPDLTARQFVDYMAILKGMDQTALRQKRVNEVMALVGLIGDADRKLKTYSGGMRRRVGIAQALVNDPQILIVDEPTAGLDPEERIRFRNLLVELAVDRVVILSTHIVEDIGQTCIDLAVLNKGRLLFRGSPSDLIRSAEGKVWTVMTTQPRKPENGLKVVSTLHLSEGIQYRLVGADARQYTQAESASPGLEDGYVWLMQQNGGTADVEMG